MILGNVLPLSLNMYGAGDLWLTGTDNSLPHLNDLGRPELPFDTLGVSLEPSRRT